MKLNGLENFFKTVDNNIIDFRQQDIYGTNPLLFVLAHDSLYQFNLSNEQIYHILIHTDLTQKNLFGYTPLFYYVRFFPIIKNKFSEKNLDYLIKNSNLNDVNEYNWNILMLLIRYGNQLLDLLSYQQIEYVLNYFEPPFKEVSNSNYLLNENYFINELQKLKSKCNHNKFLEKTLSEKIKIEQNKKNKI